MKTKNIQHTVLIRATPKEVYDALMRLPRLLIVLCPVISYECGQQHFL